MRRSHQSLSVEVSAPTDSGITVPSVPQRPAGLGNPPLLSLTHARTLTHTRARSDQGVNSSKPDLVSSSQINKFHQNANQFLLRRLRLPTTGHLARTFIFFSRHVWHVSTSLFPFPRNGKKQQQRQKEALHQDGNENCKLQTASVCGRYACALVCARLFLQGPGVDGRGCCCKD